MFLLHFIITIIKLEVYTHTQCSGLSQETNDTHCKFYAIISIFHLLLCVPADKILSGAGTVCYFKFSPFSVFWQNLVKTRISPKQLSKVIVKVLHTYLFK